MVNRGGLFHCRIAFKHFLYAIEYVVKQEMRLGKESAMKAGFQEKMSSIIWQDEDVLFWWSTLCAITDVDNTTAKALLPQIVALYVTIRGFALLAGEWRPSSKVTRRATRGPRARGTNSRPMLTTSQLLLHVHVLLATYPLFSHLPPPCPPPPPAHPGGPTFI